MKKTTVKLHVSERALFGRINRKLAKDGERLKKCPEASRSFNELGSFYGVDLRGNYIIYKHVDIEKFGREIGVLAASECCLD